MTRILLEGNIAAGKTTLLKRIAEMSHEVNGKRIEIVKEPVKIWTNSPAGNLLTASNKKQINQTLFQVIANYLKKQRE
jgi:thymidylate kinase